MDSSSSITDAADKTIKHIKVTPASCWLKKKRKFGPFFIERGFSRWTWQRIEKAKFQWGDYVGNILAKFSKQSSSKSCSD